MDALRASYGGASSDSDSSPTISPVSSPPPSTSNYNPHQTSTSLPPPPLALLHSPDSFGAFDYLQTEQPTRVRSFPHVQGNYALHVYIPVDSCYLPSSCSSYTIFAQEGAGSVFEKGREFHISLGRTVPIRVHQRDSVLTMLRQKLQFQKMYWIDFAKWVVFVNDDFTRSFLSMEVIAGGLAEVRMNNSFGLFPSHQITKQIDAVNEVYRLHNLPEFYKDPRPHISVAWASGDVGDFMTGVVEEEMKRFSLTGGSSRKHIFTCKFGGVKCRIGNRTYEICKFQEL
ncbi:uncharacterized protein [Coffea arabica]|uniref:U6 snRNA phosphodiesterase n=1 Tax=Coffea arabica TaxID=13443 RepID=A0A6P6VZB3_COFAR|nr:U6 snRNA phosphodiesterase-like isoform X5 [Coffea arabica]